MGEGEAVNKKPGVGVQGQISGSVNLLRTCAECEYLSSDSASAESWWYECSHPSFRGSRCLPLDIQMKIDFDEYIPPPDWCPLRRKEGVDLEAAQNLSKKM